MYGILVNWSPQLLREAFSIYFTPEETSLASLLKKKIINLNKGNYGKEMAMSAMWLKLFPHNIQDIFQ